MSTRQIRRHVAKLEQEKQKNGNEDKKEEDEPAEDERPPQMNLYDGLQVSSSDESGLTGYQDEANAVIPEEDKYGAKKKILTPKSNNNKKKNKKKKTKVEKKLHEIDEVEWSVREVNRILGTLPRALDLKETEDDKKITPLKNLFKINPYNINVNYELAKVFGEDSKLKKIRQMGTRKMRREIGLSPDTDQYQIKGLSMVRYKTLGAVKYFKFEHTQDYQARCVNSIMSIRASLYRGSHENRLYYKNCVESIIENFDVLFDVGEHAKAKEHLEEAIYCMQVIAEHTFNYVDGHCRVEYLYVENRVFLIAILKYVHILTNVACHRTALELAKVLINLDPSDPLAVIFIMDTLAIRAQEFQWLIDLIELWREKRQAHILFHMRYSRSLALFHIAYNKKDQDGIEEATEDLIEAIRLYPQVVLKILEYSKKNVSDDIMKHAFFAPLQKITVSHDFSELMLLYSWLIGPRWKEPHVWKWLMETVRKQLDLYDIDPKVGEKQKKRSAILTVQLYRRLPTQIKRHLYAIRAMASYISEGRMPDTVPSISFNPFPKASGGIDTYGYYLDWVTRYEPLETQQGGD